MNKHIMNIRKHNYAINTLKQNKGRFFKVGIRYFQGCKQSVLLHMVCPINYIMNINNII